MSTINDPAILFNRWFESAFAKLRELNDGDGAIAGLMIALPLFERYIHIKKAAAGGISFYGLIAAELMLADKFEAEEFWKAFRHGFCHTGMPFENDRENNPLPKVTLSDAGPKFPQKMPIPGTTGVFLWDPWKFFDHVCSLYKTDPSLLTGHSQAPLLPIHIPDAPQ